MIQGYSFDTYATNVEAEPGMLFGAPVSSEAVRTISIAGKFQKMRQRLHMTI